MISKVYLHRRVILLILFLYLIPALACNFPIPAEPTESFEELSVTLTVLAGTKVIEQTALPEVEKATETSISEFNNTPTPPGSIVVPLATPRLDTTGTHFIYFTQTGDTLPAIAKRFRVLPEQVSASQSLAPAALLPPGLELMIPNQLGETRFSDFILPDSEIIYSPSTVDFQVAEFIQNAGGFLSTYSEEIDGKVLSSAEIVQKVAAENSINPRLLLAVLEYRSGWVYGELADPAQLAHPIGFFVPDHKGLYYELVLTATHMGVGYYGWRTGTLTSLSFADGGFLRISPGLNPGSVALQNFFSKLNNQEEWQRTLYGEQGFIPLYQQMYGDPWERDAQAGPIFHLGLTQPELELPYAPGERWGFTGGPHLSWNSGSPRGAIDFSPVTGDAPCTNTNAWVTASAAGRVTRSADNVVAIDLDGDGYEQTGWVLVYLHISERDSISAGEQVEVDQQIGHLDQQMVEDFR